MGDFETQPSYLGPVGKKPRIGLGTRRGVIRTCRVKFEKVGCGLPEDIEQWLARAGRTGVKG